jgi:hypothetical protein
METATEEGQTRLIEGRAIEKALAKWGELAGDTVSDHRLCQSFL